MQRQRVMRHRSLVTLSNAVVEKSTDMFLTPMHGEFNLYRLYDPVLVTALQQSKYCDFDFISDTFFNSPMLNSKTKRMIDINNDYNRSTIITNSNTTTILLRQQQAVIKKNDNQLQRRLSLVEALSNNSFYDTQRNFLLDDECIVKHDNYWKHNTSEKENCDFLSENFITNLDDFETTFFLPNAPNILNHQEMLRRRCAAGPVTVSSNFGYNLNDNNMIDKQQQILDNLPLKFPVNNQESEMAKQRPSVFYSQNNANPKQLQHNPQQQQFQRERRSCSQPLCQHRQIVNAKRQTPDDILTVDTNNCFTVNDGNIEYDNFEQAQHNCALPSTSSMEFLQFRHAENKNNAHRRRKIELANENKQYHISRVDRFSVDSEACALSQDSGIRSSTHSNSSTVTSMSNDKGNFMNRELLFVVEAIWDHVAIMADELPFFAGDIIIVLDSTSTTGLWYGVCKDSRGWFPMSYVRSNILKNSMNCAMPESKPNNEDKRLSSTSYSSLCNSTSSSSANCTTTNSDNTFPSVCSEEIAKDAAAKENNFPQQMRYLRRKIIEELLMTERNYVKLLNNLVYGFIEQCRRRKELFTEERISRIFGNIEQISLIQSKLLNDFEMCFDKKVPENTCLANAFLRNSQHFGVYTEYCNNRPVSCAELANLERTPKYHHFFEACRLLRGMANLSLEGFLLTPVQRICRYPLQLFELLKATPPRHPDRKALEKAHYTMSAVASHINDEKRRVDAIQKIVLWQRNVHGFRGPDLVDNNHRMLISGEMHCRAIQRGSAFLKESVRGVNNSSSDSTPTVQWSKTVHVYLFDQSIILCKKDVLKKNCLVFKERMSLQSTSVQSLHDGKEPITGANLRNSFKLMGPNREYIFSCPDPATKGLWLDIFSTKPKPAPPNFAEKRLALLTLNYLP